MQKWRQNVCNSSYGFIYNELKGTFENSTYFSLIEQPKYRYQFVKFITRNHNLAVVTGGWHKPRPIPYEERQCQTCNVIEDEFHVVLQCRKFNALRKRYVPEYFWCRPSVYKLLQLLSSTDVKRMRNLSIFVYKIFHVQNRN